MFLPIKMILVRTRSGVVLISPVPEIKLFKEQIDEFGKVTDIVAPNLLHNLGIKSAQKLYPDAKVWGVKGYDSKIPEINWQELNSETWTYKEELPLVEIKGMPKINEVVFLHPQSESLIVTDLCFNYIDGKGLGYWLMFKMFGTYRRFGVSRLYLSMVANKEAFKQSLQEVFSKDFDNLIIPHGQNFNGGGREKLIDAFKERGFTLPPHD